ncbi:CDP-diacylglycerol--glycerol-3-phosphate 3-phosphatidyltransferase [Cyanobacterium sp. IPPAS B-1200]|uniref:CDP-diacylglycerol--glycerol-3-phosphate 3-phosphatidyltransferase n=1 Tax=Cyanobacterium sp. IPPAS B-1200 TaxID=1562720 RepID=UPI00085247C6|nr:CDP-diacylglycerol--glycerol-3-phosphate 3-phosphatidyltransferase [Cyanobacterium sp. IPPAS B-1200]OEJ77562.1 CDP-diacylglycerol--glycerol-3-phosphate 3-phosphatidyltransferase [Cyanobacterium sp. IPPAS B-1200]
MNLPNTITFSRIVLIVPILWCLYQPMEIYQWWAWGLFLLASLTDWLDGYLARRLNQVTDLGKFLDPLTDKILVVAPLLVLVERQIIPSWGVFLILLREIAIAGWRVSPQQKTISGANLWGKFKTVSQISAIAILLLPRYPWALEIGIIIFWVSVTLTIVSGLIYLIPQQETA